MIDQASTTFIYAALRYYIRRTEATKVRYIIKRLTPLQFYKRLTTYRQESPWFSHPLNGLIACGFQIPAAILSYPVGYPGGWHLDNMNETISTWKDNCRDNLTKHDYPLVTSLSQLDEKDYVICRSIDYYGEIINEVLLRVNDIRVVSWFGRRGPTIVYCSGRYSFSVGVENVDHDWARDLHCQVGYHRMQKSSRKSQHPIKYSRLFHIGKVPTLFHLAVMKVRYTYYRNKDMVRLPEDLYEKIFPSNY